MEVLKDTLVRLVALIKQTWVCFQPHQIGEAFFLEFLFAPQGGQKQKQPEGLDIYVVDGYIISVGRESPAIQKSSYQLQLNYNYIIFSLKT